MTNFINIKTGVEFSLSGSANFSTLNNSLSFTDLFSDTYIFNHVGVSYDGLDLSIRLCPNVWQKVFDHFKINFEVPY